MSKPDFLKNIKWNRNTILIGVAVIGIIICAGLIYINSNHGFTLPTIFGKSDTQIGKDAVNYINTKQLSSTPATFVSASDSEGLIKVKIKIGTSSFDSYVTKDGKFLFPQAIDMSGVKATAAAASQNTNSGSNAPAQTADQAAAAVKKTSSPSLEAFVVSSCPYGLQMQRAIVDAVKNAPSLAGYVKIRYIGDVNSDGKTIDSMHGPEEGAENLRQICIREEQPSLYWNYLACYMKKTTATASSGMPLGDSTGCQASVGIDTSSLNACVTDPSRGLAYAQKDFTLDTKYNVSGSPTLVLDGATIDETPFGGRSSDGVKSMVCAGFSSAKPSFCSTKLNTAAASTSFSATYAAAGSSGGGSTQCGS